LQRKKLGKRERVGHVKSLSQPLDCENFMIRCPAKADATKEEGEVEK